MTFSASRNFAAVFFPELALCLRFLPAQLTGRPAVKRGSAICPFLVEAVLAYWQDPQALFLPESHIESPSKRRINSGPQGQWRLLPRLLAPLPGKAGSGVGVLWGQLATQPLGLHFARHLAVELGQVAFCAHEVLWKRLRSLTFHTAFEDVL